jgi:hypothetical protein
MYTKSQRWLELLVAKEEMKKNPIEKVSFFKKIFLSIFL